jgi:hypothetical protein
MTFQDRTIILGTPASGKNVGAVTAGACDLALRAGAAKWAILGRGV